MHSRGTYLFIIKSTFSPAFLPILVLHFVALSQPVSELFRVLILNIMPILTMQIVIDTVTDHIAYQLGKKAKDIR
jgi:hypothetical protein